MPNGLITPGLVLEIAEAGEDLVITQQEFSSIIGSITSIFTGVMTAVFIGMLIKSAMKEFTKETRVKVPIYG